MKSLLCMLACLLASSQALCAAVAGTADGACGAPPGAGAAARQASLREPVAAAIAALDNARVALASPSLASDTVTYLDISPEFSDQLDKVCVLGYFELARAGGAVTLPLVVESIETFKDPDAPDLARARTSTRVYFRVPGVDEFAGGPAWHFWDRDLALHLKIAAFAYADGVRGHVHFGRDLRITVSGKRASIVAALLFAVFFYLVAGAATVPLGRVAGAVGRGRRWRGAVRRLLPWNITGANGQASLSQLQMLLFTLIVATLLFYQWLRTGLLQDLSTDLLYLIGISTAGTAATQVAMAVRKHLDPATYAYVQRLGWFTAPLLEAEGRGRPSGLLLTNRRFDIYKFQMLVFTCVIAAYVIASGANQLGNVQISDTLLMLMGMSQGAYVGGRAAADQLGPLQDQLRGMQALQARYRASADPLVADELRRQFRMAAQQAGAMFGAMYGRALAPHMIEMPPDAATMADNLPPPLPPAAG